MPEKAYVLRLPDGTFVRFVTEETLVLTDKLDEAGLYTEEGSKEARRLLLGHLGQTQRTAPGIH
jgi:hypothetical protein